MKLKFKVNTDKGEVSMNMQKFQAPEDISYLIGTALMLKEERGNALAVAKTIFDLMENIEGLDFKEDGEEIAKVTLKTLAENLAKYGDKKEKKEND